MKIPSLSKGDAKSTTDSHARKPEKVAAPKRRKKFSGKQIAALMAILVLAVLFVRRRAAKSGEEHPEVKTAVVERGDVRQSVSASGTLQAFTMVDVKSKAGGTVLKMAVEEGTRVKKGQLIALIDQQDTAAAYKQAMADLDTQRAALRQAQANARLQSASIGPQIAQSSEALNTSQSRLAQARQNLDLQKETIGPQIQQSIETLNSSRVKLAQARESLTLQRRTSETDISQARGNLTAAEARLDQAQEQAKAQPELTRSSVAQAQASVDASQANLRSSQESLRLLQSSTFPQEVASSQAQVNQFRSDVEVAQTNLNRYEGLLAKGFVPQNQVDTARNQLVSARSSLSTAQARLDTLKDDQAARLQDAQSRVEAAQGSLKQSQAGLASARTNSVQDTLKQKDVSAARAAVVQARAGLNSALANRRQINLKEADVKAAEAAVRQADASLKATQANTRQTTVRAADVDAAAAAVRQSAAALKGAQANTIQSSVRAEDIAQAQARVTRAEVTALNARENLQQTRVEAPRDGVVLKKYVDEGTIIQSGQSGFSGGTAIVQLANVSRIYVDTLVDEADIALIAPGQKVDITLDAYPNSVKSGEVRKIYPEAETVTNVTYIHVQVEIDPMDVDERLRPLMNATCDFEVENKQDTLKVPSEAVKDDEDTSTVTVIKDPKKPLWEESNQVKKTVEVGVRGDESTEIVSGLQEGETVVTQIIEPITTATTTAAPGAGLGGGGGRGGGGRGGMRGFR